MADVVDVKFGGVAGVFEVGFGGVGGGFGNHLVITAVGYENGLGALGGQAVVQFVGAGQGGAEGGQSGEKVGAA